MTQSIQPHPDNDATGAAKDALLCDWCGDPLPPDATTSDLGDFCTRSCANRSLAHSARPSLLFTTRERD